LGGSPDAAGDRSQHSTDSDGTAAGDGVCTLAIERPRSVTTMQVAVMAEVSEMQSQLALINDNPILGLQESAELLARQLGADLVA
jgi:hypothetical protein